MLQPRNTPNGNRPDTRGSVLVLTALLLPLLFMFAGLAVDTGSLYAQKARLQNIADAAALAGAGTLRNKDGEDTPINLALVLPDDKEPAEGVAIANAGADEFIRTNSGNELSIADATTSLYKKTDDNGDTLYYYFIAVQYTTPTYFMKIIDINETTVGAGAIAVYRKPKKIEKDWYHMFHWELAQIDAAERLAYDQHALVNMASLFIGRTPKQALKIINPTNPQANENHIRNGKEILILNYQDKQNDDTYIETFIGFGDTRSPQAINWSRDDFGAYDETLGYIPLDTYDPALGHFADMRFFFSDWMLQDWPTVDNNKRTFRISFKLDANGLISEARVRVNRSRNYLHELDMTVTNSGYAGKTHPEATGAYTDTAL